MDLEGVGVVLLRVLLVMIFVSGVAAQNYPVSQLLGGLDSAVLIRAQIPFPGTGKFTTTTRYSMINAAVGETCSDYPAYERTDTIALFLDSAGAQLPDAFNRIISAFRMRGDTLQVPLSVITQDSLNVLKARSGSGWRHDLSKIKSPEYVITQDQRLYLEPAWADSTRPDSVVIRYYGIPANLAAVGDSSHVKSKYIMKVVYHTLMEVFLLKEDPQKAAFYELLYDPKRKRPPIDRVQEDNR